MFSTNELIGIGMIFLIVWAVGTAGVYGLDNPGTTFSSSFVMGGVVAFLVLWVIIAAKLMGG